ncbi:MAG: VOC family protein [Streptococcus intermedius]|uniref:VOC family protein n=1 Tax=Streptococcus intermedius TaxID=1338 RepID=A0A930WEU5_STRIT|nr:VOC family protein [Streptococcus intermedius]
MKIEHVALYVRDLEGAKRFLKGILMQKLISSIIQSWLAVLLPQL